MEYKQTELPVETPETPGPPTDLPDPCQGSVDLETSEAIRTPTIPRPRPQGGPASTEVEEVPPEADRVALFSGGVDSLAATLDAMETHGADLVVYLDTNTGLAENLEYCRAVVEEMNWPFYVAESPVEYETICKRYGAPGPDAHSWTYAFLKERQLRHISRTVDRTVKFFSGVSKNESDRRKINVTGEVQYDDVGFWWVSPRWDTTKQDRLDLVEEWGLQINPLYEKIGRSGDCWCLAYGGWDEIYNALLSLSNLDDRDPRLAEHGAWLLNIQTRVQEYRGRIALVRDESPDVINRVNSIRKQQRPHPSRMQVLKQHYPDRYEAVVSRSVREAVRRGKQEPTNYIGHGGVSTKELRAVVAANSTKQATLCGDDCGKRSFYGNE